MEKEREYNMDYLRIVCCFLIVLLHFSSSYWGSVPLESFSFKTMSIYNCISRVGVPIFIMLSGYFLLGRKNAFNIKEYLKRPAKLLLTFYVWAAFYAFQGIAVELIKTGTATPERIAYTKSEFIYGHYHMWFCFLIFGYYLLLPIAKKIAEEIKVLRLFIILWVIWAFAIPCICGWANLTTVYGYLSKFEMNAVKGYWGYFLLGYYIKCCDWTLVKRVIVYLLGMASLGITIFLTISQSISTGEYVDTWFSTGSPFVLLMSMALFLLFFSIKNGQNTKINMLAVRVSECTFFIYMLHVFLLEKMNLVGITTISFNPLISVPLLSAVAFAIALFVALIVKRIPVIGKILLLKW